MLFFKGPFASFAFRGTCFLVWATLLLISAIRSESHDVSSPADLSVNEGNRAFERGAFGEALSHWKQATELYKHAGNVPAQFDTLILSSQASMGLGQSKQALQSLELALALAQKNDDP